MERKQGIADQKQKTADESSEASFNLSMLPSQMDAEGYETGTDAWYNNMRERSARDLSMLPASLRKAAESNMYKKYKDDRDFKLKLLESDEKAFAKEYGREITGDDLKIDTRPMYYPNSLPDEYTGGWAGTSLGAKKTGNKIVQGITDQGTIGPRPTSMERLNEFKKRYEELIKRRTHLGPNVDRPDLGLPGINPDKKTVRVIAPDGTHGSLPADAVSDYVNNRGYTLEE
jgi:hypothetical protein